MRKSRTIEPDTLALMTEKALEKHRDRLVADIAANARTIVKLQKQGKTLGREHDQVTDALMQFDDVTKEVPA